MANIYYTRRLMGPIVLITIGLLFLLDQIGDWSFGRTWPILLIVIGAVKIFERFFTHPIPTNVPPANPPQGTWQAPGSTPGSVPPPAGGSPNASVGTNEPSKS